jgi:hypothetical protein
VEFSSIPTERSARSSAGDNMHTFDPEMRLLASMLGRSLVRAEYLVTQAELESQLLEEHFHLLTHELAVEVETVGKVYFTWAEEPALNGHPIRLSVSLDSSYDSGPDLSWLDASGSSCWAYAIGNVIAGVRMFKEPSSYEGVVPPSIVTTGVELLVAGQAIQITVIAPPDDIRIPLTDWRWSPSTVVSIGSGVRDLSTRPKVRVEEITTET